jgi:hypothetical protein
MPGVVRTDARVTELRRVGSLTLESGIGRVEARAVILAVPAYVVASLLRAFDTTLAAFCDAVPYASTATVAFGYTREQIAHPMQGTGFVVPRVERSALLAGTWVTSKWPGRAPEGHVLLRGFLGGGRDPQRLEDSDEELISTARTELSDLLGITGEPIITRLFRWTRQSPQYEVGHLQRVAAIDDHLASLPGVFLTGSGFRAIGIPDCIADARATAQRAAAVRVRASRRRDVRFIHARTRRVCDRSRRRTRCTSGATAAIRSPHAADRIRPQEDQGCRQGPVGRVGRRWPLPACADREPQRKVDPRDRRRQRVQRDLARSRRARIGRTRCGDRVRPAARERKRQTTSVLPA